MYRVQPELVHCWRRFRSLVVFSVGIASGLAINSTAQGSRAPLSVCAALDKSTVLDGQEVAVRGRWISGLEHAGIYPYKCSPMPPTDEGELSAIRITSEGTSASLEDARATFFRLRSTLKRHSFVVATFRGKLRKAGTSGSGHLSEFRVDLVVREIRDIAIAREPSRRARRRGDR